MLELICSGWLVLICCPKFVNSCVTVLIKDIFVSLTSLSAFKSILSQHRSDHDSVVPVKIKF